MRIGLLLPTAHHRRLTDWSLRAEAEGYDLVALGDSPLVYRELYASLATVAAATSRIALGTAVTNVMTRDPTVVASGMATVNEIADGRLVLGLGTGDSSVRVAGQRPAHRAALRRAVSEIRALLDTDPPGPAGGRRVSWNTRRLPIHLASEGPRTQELAGEIADGVIIGSGLDAAVVPMALAAVARGAERAGRGLDDLEVWFFARVSVDQDPALAVERIRSGLAASAHRSLTAPTSTDRVPAEHAPALQQLARRYDVTGHLDGSGHNATLVDELELTAFLAERFGIVGPVDACVRRIAELERLGVDGLLISAAVEDVPGFLDRLAPVVAELRGR